MPWVFVIKAFGFVLGYNGSARAVRIYHIKNTCTKKGVAAHIGFGTLETLESISLITHIYVLGFCGLAWLYCNTAHSKRLLLWHFKGWSTNTTPKFSGAAKWERLRCQEPGQAPKPLWHPALQGVAHSTSMSSWMFCVQPDSAEVGSVKSRSVPGSEELLTDDSVFYCEVVRDTSKRHLTSVHWPVQFPGMRPHAKVFASQKLA